MEAIIFHTLRTAKRAVRLTQKVLSKVGVLFTFSGENVIRSNVSGNPIFMIRMPEFVVLFFAFGTEELFALDVATVGNSLRVLVLRAESLFHFLKKLVVEEEKKRFSQAKKF